MATTETREAIRAGRKAVRETIEEASENGHANGNGVAAKFLAPPTPPSAEPSPLEDLKTQEDIVDPVPEPVTIGGEPVELHELSARASRAFASLLQDVFIDLGESGKRSHKETLPGRVVSAIANDYNDRIMPIIALATAPAGSVSEDESKAIARDIDSRLQYPEMSRIIVMLMVKYLPKSKNGTAPKNG